MVVKYPQKISKKGTNSFSTLFFYFFYRKIWELSHKTISLPRSLIPESDARMQ